MSLRKEKAARIRLAILDQALKLVGKRPFQDLYVDDICAKVKISKVTFFKYFPQKEDILLYFFRLWCLRRAVELKEKPKQGLSGIQYLFDRLADDCEAFPGIMLGLVGYLSDPKRPRKPFPVKVEEKVLLFPEVREVNHIEILSIEQMIENFVLEAIFNKEITRTTSTPEITRLLSTVLYGTMVTGHLTQQQPSKMYFRKNLDMTVKGLA